jgi:hypothetical protein
MVQPPKFIRRVHTSSYLQNMRQIVLLILIAVCSQGCVIPGIEGPVSRSLTASRQLSLRGVAAMEQGRDAEAQTLLAKAVTACP